MSGSRKVAQKTGGGHGTRLGGQEPSKGLADAEAAEDCAFLEAAVAAAEVCDEPEVDMADEYSFISSKIR